MNSSLSNYLKAQLFFALIVGQAAGLFAQTSDLGGPKMWQQKEDVEITKIVLPSVDVEELKAEDAINQANKVGPFRFGHEHIMDVDVFETATRTTLEDGGEVFRLEFSSKDAITMNVFFLEFELEDGEAVYIYDKNGRYYDGAYTAENNQPDGLLGTIPIPTNKIVLEYYRPEGIESNSRLRIGHVVQGYRNMAKYFIGALYTAKGLNDSGPCNYDTGCSELPGNPFGTPGEWNDQIASIAVMLSGGSRICSAALVNNTANDGTPYVLSANHCGTSNGGGRSFLFSYESPTNSCASNSNSTDGPTTNIMNGATLRASNSGSDVALWELNSDIPASYNVYYAGWDNSGTPPTEVTGIHHPRGDVKKMCREEDSPYYDTAGGAAVWWIDEWEWGVTEPGSSGSPIFDQNKRIVGQLYGGLAACSGTVNNGTYDYYGRFDVSWDNGGSASSRLEDWLDPLGTNPQAIDGYNPNQPTSSLDAAVQSISGVSGYNCNVTSFSPEVVIRNAGSTTLTSLDISYSLDGTSLGSISWSGSLATNQTANVSLPTLEISSSGNYNYEVSLSNPNGGSDENVSNNSGSSAFEVAVDAASAELSLTFDCWANEVSWELVSNASGNIVASGDGYSGTLDGVTITETFCLAAGCYTFNIFDSFGDGMNGSQYSFCGIDGDYSITDNSTGQVLVDMTAPNADYGDGTSHTFCIDTDEVPCQLPYPEVQNLSTSVQGNGILLQWDPILGSQGCQIEGGLASSSALVSFQTIQPNPSEFFVSESQLNNNTTYRWRVRCGCTNSIIGPWSGFDFFTWNSSKANISGSDEVVVFPNPAEDEVNFQLGSELNGFFVLRIYDLQGRIVDESSVFIESGQVVKMNVKELDPGVYILNASDGSTAITGRFIKKM